ncbi:MAG TPA: response regulator, partial [Thermoanaerobaculia bacterium]
DRLWLGDILRRAGYAVEMATTGATAVELCRERRFDAMCLDLLLPDTSGLDVLRAIRSQPLNQTTPVIVVTVVEEKGTLGFLVHDFLTKPVDPHRLTASLERADVTPGGSRPILVVDPDPSALALARAALEPAGYRVFCAADGEEALQAAREISPAAVVVELHLDGPIDGFELLEKLRRSAGGREQSVIVWSAADPEPDARRRLRALAESVLVKEDQAASLLAELSRLVPVRLRQQGSPHG